MQHAEVNKVVKLADISFCILINQNKFNEVSKNILSVIIVRFSNLYSENFLGPFRYNKNVSKNYNAIFFAIVIEFFACYYNK